MTVGHFTIETSSSTDDDFLSAYEAACYALLECLREQIPSQVKSPADSAVTLEKLDIFYVYRFNTPMERARIEEIISAANELEQFHILKWRPINIALIP